MISADLITTLSRTREVDPALKARILKALLGHRADISDVKINTRLLNNLIFTYADAEGRLYELNQLKNKFLGIAAHDLRNPLTSIRGFSEFLLNGELGKISEEQQEFVSMIYSLSQTMLDMVNDLLDVSVIESGQLSLEKQTGSMGDLVSGRIRILAMMAEAKGMHITQAISVLPPLAFDPVRMGQVVDNLISNAVKFSPRDTKIAVSVIRSGSEAVICVEDQGPGIQEKDKEGMFGEFAKLSARPTGEEKSTGLGLAICKKIIDAHGGRIWAENRKEGGARFSIALSIGEAP